MPETRSAIETVEPYKISEIFSIVPDYDGNPIFLNTFISSCTTAQNMAVGNQSTLLVLHIKNKLRGRAAELVNSRNPSSWDEIRDLLENHFGDSRDLSSLIQDLQRMRQMPNESPLTFAARLQTHEAKMHSAVNKQNLTTKEKSAQITLIESMALNSLLTGVEPRIGQILRASDPDSIVTAVSRMRRELQLNHLEAQKFSNNRNGPTQTRKPPTPIKQCSFCSRTGHTYNECLIRQRQFQQPHNSNNNFRPNPFSHNRQSNGYRPQNGFQHNRPSTSGTNTPPSHNNNNNNYNNGNSNRPPNFFRHQKTHHLNDTNYEYDEYDSGYETSNLQKDLSYENQYHDFSSHDSHDFPDYYHTSQYFQDNFQHFQDNSNPNFHPKPPQTAPPDLQVENLQNQIQTMNLEDSFDPNLNFPEQGFL